MIFRTKIFFSFRYFNIDHNRCKLCTFNMYNEIFPLYIKVKMIIQYNLVDDWFVFSYLANSFNL